MCLGVRRPPAGASSGSCAAPCRASATGWKRRSRARPTWTSTGSRPCTAARVRSCAPCGRLSPRTCRRGSAWRPASSRPGSPPTAPRRRSPSRSRTLRPPSSRPARLIVCPAPAPAATGCAASGCTPWAPSPPYDRRRSSIGSGTRAGAPGRSAGASIRVPWSPSRSRSRWSSASSCPSPPPPWRACWPGWQSSCSAPSPGRWCGAAPRAGPSAGSAAQLQIARRLRARTLQDLAHQVALIRPGVGVQGGAVSQFIARHRAGAAGRVDHPLEARALARTDGVIVWQEQVVQLIMDVAGMSAAAAATLRRAFARPQGAQFIAGQRQRVLAERAAGACPRTSRGRSSPRSPATPCSRSPTPSPSPPTRRPG